MGGNLFVAIKSDLYAAQLYKSGFTQRNTEATYVFNNKHAEEALFSLLLVVVRPQRANNHCHLSAVYHLCDTVNGRHFLRHIRPSRE